MPSRQAGQDWTEAEREKLAQEWIQNADDKILACRGEGHNVPKLRSNRRGVQPLPKGVAAIPAHDGSFKLRFTCRDCGAELHYLTLPGGQMDLDAPAMRTWDYSNVPGYNTNGIGHAVRKRACFAESWRRTQEDMAAAGARAVIFNDGNGNKS